MTDDDRSAGRAGAIIRSEREQRALSLAQLAAEAGVSVANLSRLERGQRASTLDLADRVLRAMGLRLHVEAEPMFADIDDMIAQAADRSLTDVVKGWEIDAAAYFSLLNGVPFIVEGMAAAALQGVPAQVETLEIAVPADDEEALDEFAFTMEGIGAHRGYYETRDPREPGSPDYKSMHGTLRVRLVSPFEQVCWVDIDPLPEPDFRLVWFLREMREPLPRARVAVTPLFRIEAESGQVRRVIQRVRDLSGFGG